MGECGRKTAVLRLSMGESLELACHRNKHVRVVAGRLGLKNILATTEPKAQQPNVGGDAELDSALPDREY